MADLVRPSLQDALRRIKRRMEVDHARTVRQLDRLLSGCICPSEDAADQDPGCALSDCPEHGESPLHHNGHYGVLAMHAFGPRDADGLCGAIVQYPVNGEVRNVPCGAEPHHESHYGAPGLPVCVCLVQGAGRAFCPIHAADENPCGKGCSDPRAHAEGAHDV